MRCAPTTRLIVIKRSAQQIAAGSGKCRTPAIEQGMTKCAAHRQVSKYHNRGAKTEKTVATTSACQPASLHITIEGAAHHHVSKSRSNAQRANCSTNGDPKRRNITSLKHDPGNLKQQPATWHY